MPRTRKLDDSYRFLVATHGRPTKFRKSLIEEMVKFFDIEPTRKELMEVVTEFDREGKPKKTAEKWKHVPNKFPTLIQFAKHAKLSYFSLLEWAEKGADPKIERKLARNEGLSTREVEMMKDLQRFSQTYKQAKAMQKDFLLQNGLNGASPSSAFIFTAKNVTDMRDKVESDVNVREVKPLLANLVNNNGVLNHHRDEEDSGTDEEN